MRREVEEKGKEEKEQKQKDEKEEKDGEEEEEDEEADDDGDDRDTRIGREVEDQDATRGERVWTGTNEGSLPVVTPCQALTRK